ncbi:DUF6118 family protein [Sphingopyxis panaciterrulae]|uniref:Uncharacterized protein n=1 Tax=Sphingopyxis panaciterrulae TaxID=462372 RepID=A0A7W9B7K1_9SPHN|nr:DUF6118 family protein [Sphingopyxis panaciterrulae]MBB5707672.1 hypothetical protein [Sphingopyxis panaciterrulae]
MNSPSTSETDPAARAFAELGEKVGLLEAAVRGLVAKRDAAPDYSDTLTEIAALLEKMRVAINDFARSSAMQLTPDDMAAQIAAAGTKARAQDSAIIEKARGRFDNAAYRMEQLTGTAATIRDQRRRLLWAAGGSLFAGMLLWSFLPGVLLRALPQSWHMPENMARHIIGEPSLWGAGSRLMQAGSPEDWRAIVDAAQMRVDNRKAIDSCEQKAHKTRRSVRCTIRVGAQAQRA